MSDYSQEEWYIHFATSYRSQQREVELLMPVMELYEKLRRDNLDYRNQRSPILADSGNRMDQALMQKSRQIESQQSLLNDLQSQLSSKEREVRDLNKQLTTSITQANQLKLQLESTHALLQEKELEIIRLRNEIREMEASKLEIVEPLNQNEPEERSFTNFSIPSRVISTYQLSACSGPPGFITATRGFPQHVAVGSNRIATFNGCTGALICESDMILNTSGATLLCGAQSPENDLMLVGSSESQLSLVDVQGRLLKDLKGHSGKVKGCGFLGSKSKGFSVACDRTIKLWDLQRACPIRSVPVTSQLVGGVATGDGTMIVTCHLNGKISVWSMQDRVCEVDAHQDTCLGVSLSPDGRFIISVGKDDTVSVIDLHMAQSGPIHKLKGFKALTSDTTPSCSTDSRIVSVSGTDGIFSWDLILGSSLDKVKTDAVGVVWTGGGTANQLVSIHQHGIVKWWST
jgi:hypothetical protein